MQLSLDSEMDNTDEQSPFNYLVEELALHSHLAYAYAGLFALEFDTRL
jgi:hypothetical protein